MRVSQPVRRFLLLIVVCLLSAYVCDAVAQERQRVRLELIVAPSAMCLSPEALSAGIAARLGYDPFASESNIVVETRVDRRARSRFVASITLRDGARVLGRRELEARSCEGLASLLELAVSVAVDPLVSEREASEPTATPADTTSFTESREEPPWPMDDGNDWLPRLDRDWPSDVSANASTPEPEDDARARLLLGGGLHVTAGSAPSLGFGADFVIGAAWEWFSLRVEARGDLPVTKAVNGGRVRSVVSTVSILPCVRASVFDLCALARGGILWSEGVDFDQSGSFTSGLFELGARVNVGIPITNGWEVIVYADAAYAVARTALLVDAAEIWRNPAMTFLVGVGPLYRFP